MVSSLRPHCRGLIFPRVGVVHPKLQSHIHCQNWRQSKPRTGIQLPFERSRIIVVQHFLDKKYTPSGGGNHHHLTIGDDYDQLPFWPNLIKEAFRAFRSLFIFLAEQPSQLKHIEWPSFKNTLKTATLSLVLVGLLIVALASVDSALCYILSVLLSRRA